MSRCMGGILVALVSLRNAATQQYVGLLVKHVIQHPRFFRLE